jgi:hypothetical protein
MTVLSEVLELGLLKHYNWNSPQKIKLGLQLLGLKKSTKKRQAFAWRLLFDILYNYSLLVIASSIGFTPLAKYSIK